MILNVAASGEDIVSGDVAVDGTDELQSELVQKYPVYYEKPFHHKMKNNPWKIKNKKNKTVKAIKMFWSFRWCCLLCKLETKTKLMQQVESSLPSILFYSRLCRYVVVHIGNISSL